MKRIISTILIVIIVVGVWNPSSGMQITKADDWWDSGWEYRKEITINHDMIDADLTNFPILFHNTSSDFIEHAQNDGDDFVFIASGGLTQYNHEIEYYDNKTGELIAWVNVTSLYHTTDTNIWLYYGNSTCSSQQNPSGVWRSEYLQVLHLNENNSGVYNDSTGFNNDATVDQTTESTGKMANCTYHSYIDNSGLITIDDGSTDVSDYLTISVWLNADAWTDPQGWQTGPDKDGSWQTAFYKSGANWYMAFWNEIGTDRQATGATSLSTDTWYYCNWILQENESKCYMYLNAKNDSKDENIDNPIGIGGDLGHGTWNYSTGGDQPWHGWMDEIRLYHGVLSDAWINTSYNTMNRFSIFLSVGSEENYLDDHIPPTVKITQPEFGFIYVNLFDAQLKIPILIPYATIIIGKINITVDAEDNVEIKWVKIYIDNVERANITEPPYIWLWDEKTIIFPYTLKVKACDYSGNENSDEIKVWKMQLFF